MIYVIPVRSFRSGIRKVPRPSMSMTVWRNKTPTKWPYHQNCSAPSSMARKIPAWNGISTGPTARSPVHWAPLLKSVIRNLWGPTQKRSPRIIPWVCTKSPRASSWRKAKPTTPYQPGSSEIVWHLQPARGLSTYPVHQKRWGRRFPLQSVPDRHQRGVGASVVLLYLVLWRGFLHRLSWHRDPGSHRQSLGE